MGNRTRQQFPQILKTEPNLEPRVVTVGRLVNDPDQITERLRKELVVSDATIGWIGRPMLVLAVGINTDSKYKRGGRTPHQRAVATIQECETRISESRTRAAGQRYDARVGVYPLNGQNPQPGVAEVRLRLDLTPAEIDALREQSAGFVKIDGLRTPPYLEEPCITLPVGVIQAEPGYNFAIEREAMVAVGQIPVHMGGLAVCHFNRVNMKPSFGAA